MGNTSINRWEWHKAVTRCKSVNCTAKTVASGLVHFANDETGQCNPKLATLAEFLSMTLPTLKRALRDLVKAGWLHRTEGRGAGNATRYAFTSVAQIVPFRKSQTAAEPARENSPKPAKKKGSIMHFYDKKKGSKMNGKGFKSDTSYIEQSSEQKTRASADASRGAFRIDPSHVSEWDLWLAEHGFPGLGVIAWKNAEQPDGPFWMPRRRPPFDDEGKAVVLKFCRERIADLSRLERWQPDLLKEAMAANG